MELCRAQAPDRSGRRCDKPKGHDGEHWTYGGRSLSWVAVKCDCIASGNANKPKQHGADPHAKNCAVYIERPCVCHVDDGLVQEWISKAREVARRHEGGK